MKLHQLTCSFLFLFFLPIFAIGQGTSFELRGNVTDHNGLSLKAASVALLDVKTGVILFSTKTDEKGNFSVNTANEKVSLVISHLGYTTFVLSKLPREFLNVKMTESNLQLAEVDVTSKQDLIVQKFDRVSINISGDSKIGMSALDVFQKIPGVTITGDNVLFEGKSIAVTVDNKSTRLTGSDLMAFLNNMPTTGLAQIEVLFSPSAKYDANGSGGIINIKRLIREKPGYDFNTGIRIGRGWKYLIDNSVDVSLNLREGSNYWSANYSFGLGKRYQEIQTNTTLFAKQQFLLDSSRYSSPGYNQNLRLSWDHYFNKKNVFGVLLTAYDSQGTSVVRTETDIREFIAANIVTERISESNNLRNSRGVNINSNLKISLDTLKGEELSMDFDAGIFDFKSTNTLNIANGQNTEKSPIQRLDQVGVSPSTILSYKADYQKKFYLGLLEGGVKASYINVNNNLNSVNHFEGQQSPVDGSNDFSYKESIFAAYGSTKQVVKKLTIQLGMRLEQTNTRGNSKTLDSLVYRSYLNLFPNVSLGYKFSKSSVSMSYARRLDRPAYSYLNPFDILSSAYTSLRGNPYLKPSFSDNFRVGFNPNKHWSLATSYSIVKDVITDLSLLDDQTSITTSIKSNMNQNQRVGLSVSYSNEFFKLWSLNYSGGVSYSNYQFDYQKSSVRVSQTTSYVSLDNRVTLPNTWWLGIFFYGQSKATYGNRVNQPYCMINMSVGKKLLQGRANLTLNCNDVFFTSITKSSASYGNVDYNLKSRYDSRNIKVGFNYSLSSGKMETRRRSSGSVEEQRRNQS
ncbi:MAG: TonB-dependent receptor [Chryseobacterium sp.]|nr:MAG: TonB-dependent receptor [Chryseobacterium sp.]